MEHSYCPIDEYYVTVRLDREECRSLYRALGNSSRWENLSDYDEEFRSICENMESHCGDLDNQGLNPAAATDTGVSDTHEPNTQLDLGMDEDIPSV